MKKRSLALLMLLPFVFSSCNNNQTPPSPPDPPTPVGETTKYRFYINDDTDNPYELVKDELIHDGFTQYNYKNIPELRKGDKISFESQKGDEVTKVMPLLSANNNLYNDPNVNEYYVITTCVFETLSLNVYKEYTNAYLSGYDDEHQYSVVYNNETYQMEDVSDTKTRKDNWLMKYTASFKYDVETPFYFFEDELNLATTRQVQVSREENNNVYKVEDDTLGHVFLGYNFTPNATISFLVYQNHFEIFMTGNESSTYVSLVGCFDSLEKKEVRMPYDHDTDTATRTIHLEYYDKFLVSFDISKQKPVSLGYSQLADNDLNVYFTTTDRTTEITCIRPGTYTIQAKLEERKIYITGTPDTVSNDYYAVFLNNTRYRLTQYASDENTVTYHSFPMNVVAGDTLLTIKEANKITPESQSGYNNIARTGDNYYVYVDAEAAVYTLVVNKLTGDMTARLSGYTPAYDMTTFDKFNQDDTIQTYNLVLNESNPHADEYEEYKLASPIDVYAYRSMYLRLDSYNVTADLFDADTNNLEVLDANSGEFMVKSTAQNVQFVARIYNYGERYEIFLEGYNEATYFQAINLYIYDDASSSVVRLQQEKDFIGEVGETSFRGKASIAKGQHFAFIGFDRVPYYINTWDTTSVYYSAIQETYNYFLCTKDIENADFFLRITVTGSGEETVTTIRFFVA